jgi:hypothetical protein
MLGWAAELKKKTQPKRPSIVSLFGMVSYSSLYNEDLVRTSFCWGWELSYLAYIFLVMVFTGYASAIWKTGILRCALMILVVADCTRLQEGRTWAWCTPLFTNYSCYCMVLCTDTANLGVVSNGGEVGDTHMDVSSGEGTQTVSSSSCTKPPSSPYVNNSR